MCGICGEYRFDDQQPSLSAVQAMSDVLAPRGPHGAGQFAMNHLAVGHRRLKVIDLTEHAQQPMVDNDLGLGIVFNGCIYNYRELRRELAASGYRFFSHGDTEVILKAYHAWGTDCVKRFHGMFAFALWDGRQQRLWLVRDRLGIKPLFYARLPHRFLFGSEIKAILSDAAVPRQLDLEALAYYLASNYTPLTF